MASVHEYKRLENKFVQKIKDAVIAVGSVIAGIFRGIGHFLTRPYTVVFVPHSEKRVYNLHITVLSILCFLFVAAGILGAFFYYGASYSGTMYAIAAKDSRSKDMQASLDQLRDETALLLREARNFESALSGALSALGADPKSNNTQNTSGDLSSFLNIRETPEGLLQEVDDVRRLSSYLSQAVDPVREIGTLLNSQSALLTEIPSIWPIKDGKGHVSMFFGQNINPFNGQYYIHKGIDLSTYRQGDPIVATADGQVVTVDFDSGFGNYIIIKHKHGYYTRYAHLLSFRVKVGQRVQQNEVIGYIGNTGVSTGPHLHYEVHIGSDVVDPYKYINIRSSIAKQGR
ncbi:MAG: M23 family metallopeptidase [Treponema sp.]|jgi:murein DD-endopeptidase MepM/ murein hydrolase activator NlpD|nr:M23 family metallopeptidase [Treponema sp.]